MPKEKGKREKKKKSSPTRTKTQFNLPGYNDALLNEVFNNSHEGIGIIGDDYKIEYANEKYCQIFGVSDLVGQDFRDYFTKEMSKILTERYEARRLGERLTSVYPMDIVRKDGEIRTVEGRGSTAIGPDGKTKIIAHL
ncbi:MAG: PAS domain S-box protein, partial [Candidatus Thorarchaeota archaeon]